MADKTTTFALRTWSVSAVTGSPVFFHHLPHVKQHCHLQIRQQVLTRLHFFNWRLLCWHSGRNSVVVDPDYK